MLTNWGKKFVGAADSYCDSMCIVFRVPQKSNSNNTIKRDVNMP